MLLADLVATSARVAATRSRNAKIEHLAALLGALRGEEVLIGIAFLVGELRQGRIGLGYAAVRDASAAAARERPSGEPLYLRDVDRAFARIEALAGPGSQGRRHEELQALFARAPDDERGFLARLVVGELRQGALEGVMCEAVARASGLAVSDVRRAAMLGGSLRAVATAALVEGAAGLARFRLEVLRPLQPMLASTAESPGAALAKLGRAAFEWKVDGARVQVHKSGERVRVFSRQLNDVTRAVPEVVEAARALDADELVLDGEVVALRADGRPHPFQVTMRRFGRKLDVAAVRADLPLVPLFFDALLVGTDELVERGAEERADALARVVPADQRVPRLVTDDEARADAFFAEALERGYEGLVAKALDAPYEAGRRGGSWLKLKSAHTLDLVVLAAEQGSGRRRGTLSNLHLGARDPATGGFVMLGKTFKGMTDRVLAWQTAALLERETHREGPVVFVRPELVVEIAFDAVQTSAHYPGGVALRFARLKRYRDDKLPSEADTIDTVRALAPELDEPR